MPTYRYTAQDAQGKRVRGTQEADDAQRDLAHHHRYDFLWHAPRCGHHFFLESEL